MSLCPFVCCLCHRQLIIVCKKCCLFREHVKELLRFHNRDFRRGEIIFVSCHDAIGVICHRCMVLHGVLEIIEGMHISRKDTVRRLSSRRNIHGAVP